MGVMRMRLLGLGMTMMAGCWACSSTAVVAMPTEAATIDGVWHGFSDGMGSLLSLSLMSKAGAVSGTGTYTRGAVRTGTLLVTGQLRSPTLTLKLAYDHGETAVLTATLTGPERMTGRLTDKSGSVMKLELVRP